MKYVMSIESAADSSKKSNTNDYTISTMDDEKNGQFKSNPSIDHQKVKNDKLLNANHLIDSHPDHSDSIKCLNDKLKGDINNSATVDNHTKRQKSLCYDFKKGNCRRRFCRYPHVMSVDQVVFCHDFQNNSCFRVNCRFIHRSIEDEEHYRQYGVFPMPQERHQPPPPPPDCHINCPPQQNYYPNRDNMNMPIQHSVQTFQPNTTMPSTCRRRSFCMSENNMDSGIPVKRVHLDDGRQITVSNSSTLCRNGYVDSNIIISQPSTTAPNSVVQSMAPTYSAPTVTSVVIGEDVINIYRLYEEHNLLRRRVEINEERLQELRATNTYLLQQNEQLRRQTQCSCTNTIVNPVTLTTASQATAAQATQVLNAVSIAPVQVQATPIVSIANIAQSQTQIQPQTQIIASSAPLAIAANTTQGQQLALASTQQTGQILGTPQITLATAPSMGITMNTSQPLAMSANATQPIISYPIMTHSILPH